MKLSYALRKYSNLINGILEYCRQMYAILESRCTQEDVDSCMVLDLFKRALKANPRDAGVYQA
jgi:hypothetical protein